MTSHHGKTWTEVHGTTAEQRAHQRHMQRLQRHESNDFANFDKVNWDYYEHRQMWDMIHSAKPETMYTSAQNWVDLASGIQQTTSNVQNVMQNVMQTWQGSAAVTAGQANSKLTEWAGQAGNTSVDIGNGLSKYADAVSHAQTTMPAPVDYVAQQRLAEGYAVKVTDPKMHAYLLKQLASDQIATREQAKTAKAKAIKVMEGYESHSQDVHHTLPSFSKAPSMAPNAVDSAPPTPPPSGGGGVRPMPTPTPVNPPGPITPNPPSDPPPLPNDPTGPSPVPDPGTHIATADPLPMTGGGGGGVGGLSGYGGGTGYGTGSGSGSGSMSGLLPGGGAAGALSGAAEQGALSGARPGSLAGASGMAAEEAAAARAAAARGGAGAGGMGMYPPGGAGGRGEDDGEHHNKYDEGLDLFDDLPPAYPPVFGA